jgi:hypothetical protein
MDGVTFDLMMKESIIMATLEHVRDAMHRQPFVPFTVHLVDGRSYQVKHPDFIAIPESPRGRNLTIHDKGLHLIDMILVQEIFVPEAAETPGAENN